MIRRLAVATGFVWLLFNTGDATAQNRTLSQLTFDRPLLDVNGNPVSDTSFLSKGATEGVDPSDIVKRIEELDKGIELDRSASQETELLPAQQPTTRAALREDPKHDAFGTVARSKLVSPRVKGPAVDAHNPLTITTIATWKRKKGGSCRDAANFGEECKKAQALTELLERFSGKKDFGAAHCKETCVRPGYVSRPVRLTFRRQDGGTFKFISEGDSCRYELRHAAGREWRPLEVTSLSCECLPEECE